MIDADIDNKLRAYQRRGDIAKLSEEGGRYLVRPLGSVDIMSSLEGAAKRLIAQDEFNRQPYYFLSQLPNAAPGPDLRPGSGIIRVFGGKSEGPAGTLTCFLSSRDGRESFFVAAGHVLTNFWEDRKDEDGHPATERRHRRGGHRQGQIYRNQKGFPATGSTRFLGELQYNSAEPRLERDEDKDIGIVKLEGVEPVQRTTCYGTFAEGDHQIRIEKGLPVMKCGAEETHLTYAVVEKLRVGVTVYGPDGTRFFLKNQIILSQIPETLASTTDPPKLWSAAERQKSTVIFAVPGDSGALVVTRESRKPVGMLVAGSILDGRYVMTPFGTISCFWQKNNLILRKG